MEIKENYTREEADLMSIISSILKTNPHTFQGNSAYWIFVELDFELKEINVDVDIDTILYYTLSGVANTHGLEFNEII